jgi:LacI family transcriptional regulator, repressor for deo operon, udp, cdd, tsx, nupC, and nupG
MTGSTRSSSKNCSTPNVPGRIAVGIARLVPKPPRSGASPSRSPRQSRASPSRGDLTLRVLGCPIARAPNTRVTSVDVARAAGVSQSTVSLVFSGKARGRVSAATEEHVRRRARELGYRPNIAAQALRLGASRAVALLVPDVTNPFFARVLRGAQRAAQEAGYTVVLVDTANDRRWEEQSFEALRAGPVDGYLLFEVSPPEGLAPDEHVVLIETKAPRRSSVRFDSEAGAAAAFRHLIELGHRRIGHLASAFEAPTFDLREAARRRVLSEAGIDPDAQPRTTTPITIERARRAGGPLLDQRPTAVFCDDDIIAAGLYLAARERGLRIPRDLSVIGFDDMDFARVLDPPLTTVALDAELLGATAFELLDARMAGRRRRGTIVLPAKLRVRGSTGPPKVGAK